MTLFFKCQLLEQNVLNYALFVGATMVHYQTIPVNDLKYLSFLEQIEKNHCTCIIS